MAQSLLYACQLTLDVPLPFSWRRVLYMLVMKRGAFADPGNARRAVGVAAGRFGNQAAVHKLIPVLGMAHSYPSARSAEPSFGGVWSMAGTKSWPDFVCFRGTMFLTQNAPHEHLPLGLARCSLNSSRFAPPSPN